MDNELSWKERHPEFSALVGKTVISIARGDDSIGFVCSDGTEYVLEHRQDCCESVTIEDICGDLSDLIGSPILVAEEVCGETAQPAGWHPGEYTESYTWTFYKLDTAKGGVTIRWYGESNGYYSESVSLERLK
ncbi:MAG TPA: hypothetical protein VFM34_11250 [Moraxellaceae bacterium]|nr:hypothetical protein [Moraxellaceae bacterium]